MAPWMLACPRCEPAGACAVLSSSCDECCPLQHLIFRRRGLCKGLVTITWPAKSRGQQVPSTRMTAICTPGSLPLSNCCAFRPMRPQVYAAVFDGHGGSATAEWLQTNLLKYVEKVGSFPFQLLKLSLHGNLPAVPQPFCRPAHVPSLNRLPAALPSCPPPTHTNRCGHA